MICSLTPVLQWLSVVPGRVHASALLGCNFSRPKRQKRRPWVRKQKTFKLCRVTVEGRNLSELSWNCSSQLPLKSKVFQEAMTWGTRGIMLQNSKSGALNHDSIWVKLFPVKTFHCMCFLILSQYMNDFFTNINYAPLKFQIPFGIMMI